MTKEELEKATGQELIDERNYCGVDGYYGDYLDNVNAEMLKRFNRLAELEKRCANYEMTISKMEKGTCDICKETEKDKRITELEMTVGTLRTFSNEQATCIENLKAQIEKMQEKLKADLIARLEEQMQYSTSPSCTKGMELFIKSIKEWEIKEKC